MSLISSPKVDVFAEIAGAAPGAVGTYALLADNTTTYRDAGQTLSGASLVYSSCEDVYGASPAGTWMCLGRKGGSNISDQVTLWKRIV